MINREVIYERNTTGSYMKIPMGVRPGLDERLILKGKLKGALSVEKTYMDGNGQYWYNISGKQSLDTYCRMKQIGMDFVEQLVVSVCSELEIMEWNLIDTNCLMLDPELVFVTNSNREIIFTLYPGNNTEIGTEFQQLMEYLLTKIDHKDQEAVRAAYEIYEKTLQEGYTVMDIRDSIMFAKQQQIADEADARVRQTRGRRENNMKVRWEQGMKWSGIEEDETPRRGGMLGKDGETPEWMQKIGSYFKEHFLPKKEEKDSGPVRPEEQLYEPPEEIHPTVCLSKGRDVPKGILRYQGKEQLEDIHLAAKSVRIGQGKDADAQINRDTISQLHARIDRDGDDYYIEDLNSTNGTFVNDEALAYKKRYKLKMGDIVQFADVCYRFC